MTKKQHGEMWDAICELWNIDTRARSNATRVGRLVREFDAMEADAAEVRRRCKAYREKYPKWTCTPEALIKWWGDLAKSCKADSWEKYKQECRDKLRREREEYEQSKREKQPTLKFPKTA